MRSETLKRTIDIVVSVVALVVAAVPLAMLALAVRISMSRPVLFRQVRPGRHGQPFELIKLRTMRDQPPGRSLPDEARITKLGAWLRRTSLDELPELWNVLKGDMSLVGPRPLLVEYLERYDDRQKRRHEVRPGITGLAQVAGRNATTWAERLELDVQYAETWTLGLDLRIIGRTIGTVLRQEGIAAPDHATMPLFEGNDETSR